MSTSELGIAGDFLLRVVDGICDCFVALKSLLRVSYQFLMCNYSVLSYLPVVDSIQLDALWVVVVTEASDGLEVSCAQVQNIPVNSVSYCMKVIVDVDVQQSFLIYTFFVNLQRSRGIEV